MKWSKSVWDLLHDPSDVIGWLKLFQQQLRLTEHTQPIDLEAWAGKHLAHHLGKPPSRFHRWLCGRLATLHRERGRRLAVVAPRGAAKSTWASLIYPLYCALEGIEPYVVLTSDTHTQACLLLEALKHELEDNLALAAAYPGVCGEGPHWRQERIRLKNGAVIEALGTGSKIRGRRNRNQRPSLIVVDDPQNDGHIVSALQRERSWSWLNRAVNNAGTPETNVLLLGTALHRDCMVLLASRTPGWEAYTFKAICSGPERMDLWQRWEQLYTDLENPEHEAQARRFYEAHRAAMDAGAEVLWPEQEDLYSLMCLRVTIGKGAFAAEKQSEPVSPEQVEWPEDYFAYPGFWFDDWPDGLRLRVLALDPSKGRDSKAGDYSALVQLGVDRHGVLYVEADLWRQPTSEMVAAAVEVVRRFRPDGFAVETNQFQELLCAEFVRLGAQLGVHLPLFSINNSVSKPVRIRRLGPYLSQRRLQFKRRSPGTALLVQQLKDFPHGEHDDGPDSLEIAVRLAAELQPERHRGERGSGVMRTL
jgi:predicted phage terminase large subunit-like protein